jgi:DNA polymerase-3 subunit epsilon
VEPIIAALDTETTGLRPGDHRFVEIYISLWRGSTKIYEYHTLIDPQRSIPADVQAIHGITPSDVAGKPTWQQVAKNVQAVLAKADAHMAHNAAFDMEFIEVELKRLKLDMPKRPVIDTMDYVWATPDGKKPSLLELCTACGIAYDKSQAHRADYDVGVMVQAYHKAIEFGFAQPFVKPAAETEETALAA